MRNQAFFSSHRLFHFFLCGTGMNTHRQTDRRTYAQGLKNIRSTQLGAIKENAASFLFPLVHVLSQSTLRGSTVAVPVYGMLARLMEDTNFTTEPLREMCFFTSLGTYFLLAGSTFVPASSIMSEKVACGE